MKSRILSLTSFVLLFSMFSCSDKPAEQIATSITISASESQINLGGTFVFTVKDNLGKTLQSSVIIYVNNVAISGFTFQPATEGGFSVNAKSNGLTSNTLTLGVAKLPPTAVSLTLSKKTLSLGQSVSFTVNDNYGADVTSQSEIYINDSKITGDHYTPTQMGAFEAYAMFGQLESDKMTFTVHRFVQKVLIEDYTGTWCGYCPRVLNALEMVHAETDDVIPVAIHSGTTDPFDFSGKDILLNTFNITGYPTSFINRAETWGFPENSPPGVNQVLTKLNTVATIGLRITSNSNNGILNIGIDIEFGIDYSNAKLVVYLLEDKLNATQANYYEELYGGYSSLVNFEHNHVLRHCLTNLLGDDIPSSESKENGIYQKSFTFTTADSDISNSANVRIVAFVVDGDSGNVINVNETAVNSIVMF